MLNLCYEMKQFDSTRIESIFLQNQIYLEIS